MASESTRLAFSRALLEKATDVVERADVLGDRRRDELSTERHADPQRAMLGLLDVCRLGSRLNREIAEAFRAAEESFE